MVENRWTVNYWFFLVYFDQPSPGSLSWETMAVGVVEGYAESPVIKILKRGIGLISEMRRD
jgi:hypothetical protein